MSLTSELPVNAEALREEVKQKYREVATDPHGAHHFHPGRFGRGDRRRHDRGDAREVAFDGARAGVRPRRFREALAENLPVASGWADVAISNG